MTAIRYGVFSLGQIWTVTSDDDMRLGFPSRDMAISAAQTMVSVHRACGEKVELVVQDREGRLFTVLDPHDELAISRLPRGEAWSPFRDPIWRDIGAANSNLPDNPANDAD